MILLMPLFFGMTTYAQNDRMDIALDRYEDICDKCILLREKSLRGEEIPSKEFKSILEQVSELKSTLQAGSGNMSQSQRERFEGIRRRYSLAFQSLTTTSGITVSKVARPVMTVPKVGWVPPATAVMGHPAFLRSMSRTEQPLRQAKGRERTEIGIMALGALQSSSFSYGCMVTIPRERFGLYFKGLSNFIKVNADFYCQSDGTSDGKIIWTTGKECRSNWTIGVGGIINIVGPAKFYIGSGYGESLVLWEDSAGKWALVEDYSVKGICADAGLLFSTGHFSASVGLSTIYLQKTALEFGLGIRF